MGNCQNQSDTANVILPISFIGLKVTCKSWLKTYNDLFDYTAIEEVNTKFIEVTTSSWLQKQNQSYEITRITSKQTLHKIIQNNLSNHNPILQLQEAQNGSFQLNFQIKERITKNLPWLVVSSMPNKQYTLKQGDIVRLGKQKVRVKEIIYKDKYQDKQDEPITTIHKYYDTLNKDSKGSDLPSEENAVCRICLEEPQKDNPLISPCRCMGSAKYIHFKCIQQWLTKSINPHKVNMATVITWKPLICELCAASLPFKIYLDGKKYFTVNIPKPKRPYIVLNPVYKDQQKSKVYFLVSFSEKNRLVMGRKKDSDIRISDDASVSRFHTVFLCIEDKQRQKIVIEDNASRYGTLVLLRKQLNLKNQVSGISIQIGGDLVKFQFATRKEIDQIYDGNSINLSEMQSESNSEEEEAEEAPQNQNKNQEENQGQNNQVNQNTNRQYQNINGQN